MSTEENVEQALRDLRWAIPSEVDESILRDGVRALGEAPAAVAPPLARVRRRPCGKIAIGALTAAAAAVAIIFFAGRPSLTLADVKTSLAREAWVHLKYDNGREQWISLADGRMYFKSEDGRAVFVDHARNIRHVYRPGSGYISEDAPVIYRDGVVPRWQPASAWQYVVGELETAAKNGARDRISLDVESQADTIDGRKLVRFDQYLTDALNQRLLIWQLWADPRTRLPVRVRGRLQLAHREEQGREWIVGDYDFPAVGPSSITDLGVPAGLAVISGNVTANAQAIIEAGGQARDRWPSRWRLLRWSETESEIDLIHWDGRPISRPRLMPDYGGVKIRQERYFNMKAKHPGYHLPMPATADQVLAWTKTQVPVNLDLSDGQKTYSRSGPFPPMFPEPDKVQVRVSPAKDAGLFNSWNWPRSYQWATSDRSGPFEVVRDPPENTPGMILVRSEAGNSRMDYYIDPAHDYISVKWTRWEKRSDRWEKDWEEELLDLGQLPGGQWYARKRRIMRFGNPSRGTNPHEAIYHVDIVAFEQTPFPSDTFDAGKLMEEAKSRGATIETY